MACATLKRNLDWESMAQLPAKRRRCSPFAASSSTSPGFKVSENRSAFGEAVTAPAKLTPGLFIFVCMENCYVRITSMCLPQKVFQLDSTYNLCVYSSAVNKNERHCFIIYINDYGYHEYYYRDRARQLICEDVKEDRCVDFLISFCWFL